MTERSSPSIQEQSHPQLTICIERGDRLSIPLPLSVSPTRFLTVDWKDKEQVQPEVRIYDVEARDPNSWRVDSIIRNSLTEWDRGLMKHVPVLGGVEYGVSFDLREVRKVPHDGLLLEGLLGSYTDSKGQPREDLIKVVAKNIPYP